jgi:hypothetical protein
MYDMNTILYEWYTWNQVYGYSIFLIMADVCMARSIRFSYLN